MYPKFNLSDDFIPKKITKWFQTMIETDIAFRKVNDEVSNAPYTRRSKSLSNQSVVVFQRVRSWELCKSGMPMDGGMRFG